LCAPRDQPGGMREGSPSFSSVAPRRPRGGPARRVRRHRMHGLSLSRAPRGATRCERFLPSPEVVGGTKRLSCCAHKYIYDYSLSARVPSRNCELHPLLRRAAGCPFYRFPPYHGRFRVPRSRGGLSSPALLRTLSTAIPRAGGACATPAGEEGCGSAVLHRGRTGARISLCPKALADPEKQYDTIGGRCHPEGGAPSILSGCTKARAPTEGSVRWARRPVGYDRLWREEPRPFPTEILRSAHGLPLVSATSWRRLPSG
jgi:hypothetical protein